MCYLKNLFYFCGVKYFTKVKHKSRKTRSIEKMEEFIKQINPQPSPYEVFRERVIAACNVSPQAFYGWCRGETVSPKYRPIINSIAQEIFHRDVFADDGETLQ